MLTASRPAKVALLDLRHLPLIRLYFDQASIIRRTLLHAIHTMHFTFHPSDA